MAKAKAKSKQQHSNERPLAEIPDTPQDVSTSLRDRAMIVRVRMGAWRASGKEAAVTQEVAERYEAKGDIGYFMKKRMVSDQLRQIFQVFATARAYHRSKTLPWGDGGDRLLPSQTFFAYKKQMTIHEREFALALDAFMAVYEEETKAQKKRLGKMWNAADYPSPDYVRSLFRFQPMVEPIAAADDFRITLSTEEEAQIKRDYEAEVRARLKVAVKDVFANVQSTVAELQEKLADPDATIKGASFNALKKLVAALPELNSIVQDPNIAAMGKKIAADLLEVDVDAVAHDTATRNKTKSKADAILAALKPLQQAWTPQV